MRSADGPDEAGEEQALLRGLLELDLEQPIQVPLLCECGARDCRASIMLTLGEYADARSDSTLIIVAPDHRPDRSESVREDPEYLLVRPRETLATLDAMPPPVPRRSQHEHELGGAAAAAYTGVSVMEAQARLVAIRDVLEQEGQVLAHSRDDRLLDVLVEIDELKLSIAKALHQLGQPRRARPSRRSRHEHRPR